MIGDSADAISPGGSGATAAYGLERILFAASYMSQLSIVSSKTNFSTYPKKGTAKAVPFDVQEKEGIMKKTLVIGSAVCDIVIPLDHLPSRSEDINLYHQEMSLGGCAFNVCDILRHFEAGFLPFLPVGKGIYGQFVKQQLTARGIRSACPEPESENGCCYCLVEPDGERTFLCYHGAEYLFEEEWFRQFEKSEDARLTDSVYVCGLELEEKTGDSILSFLERHKTWRIFFAPSARICQIPQGRMKRILSLHPVLHLNQDEALRFAGTASANEAGKKLCSLTQNTVLVTCGSNGCLIFDPARETPVRVEPVPVQGTGDTIGAGDSHIGSVIALLQRGYGMEEAVRGANRIAAAVVDVRGALLSDEEARELIRQF